MKKKFVLVLLLCVCTTGCAENNIKRVEAIAVADVEVPIIESESETYNEEQVEDVVKPRKKNIASLDISALDDYQFYADETEAWLEEETEYEEETETYEEVTEYEEETETESYEEETETSETELTEDKGTLEATIDVFDVDFYDDTGFRFPDVRDNYELDYGELLFENNIYSVECSFDNGNSATIEASKDYINLPEEYLNIIGVLKIDSLDVQIIYWSDTNKGQASWYSRDICYRVSTYNLNQEEFAKFVTSVVRETYE